MCQIRRIIIRYSRVIPCVAFVNLHSVSVSPRCFDSSFLSFFFCSVPFFFHSSFVIRIYLIFFLSFFFIVLVVWHLFYCAGTTVEREIRSGIETTTTHATITLPPNVEVSKNGSGTVHLPFIGVGRYLDIFLTPCSDASVFIRRAPLTISLIYPLLSAPVLSI